MKNFCFLLVLVFALFGCSGTEPASHVEETRVLTLMTWNVCNLCDGVDNGFEYAEFRQSAGWTREKYIGRINAVSAAISGLTPQPDILMLEEIESNVILEDLAAALPKNYIDSHFANNPGAAMGLGILSRLPLTETKNHSITVNGETTPRPVLEARVQTEKGDIILFVCHFKSKLGGEEVTESIRKSSVRVILRRIRETSEEEPDTGFIIAGDLNENHDEFYRQGSKAISALIPDDPYCVKLSKEKNAGQKDFLILTGNKPPLSVHFPQESVVLFSPWMDELQNGSYYYKHNWETIDHFLISGHFFDNSDWEYEKAVIGNFEPFAGSSGIPIPYNTKTGAGLSDHFPLILTIRLFGNI
jgi:endonuclease/exonuclease/phosphatase family metal-dependent hydrolase